MLWCFWVSQGNCYWHGNFGWTYCRSASGNFAADHRWQVVLRTQLRPSTLCNSFVVAEHLFVAVEIRVYDCISACVSNIFLKELWWHPVLDLRVQSLNSPNRGYFRVVFSQVLAIPIPKHHPIQTLRFSRWELLVNNSGMYDSFWKYSYTCVFKSFSEQIIHILKLFADLR